MTRLPMMLAAVAGLALTTPVRAVDTGPDALDAAQAARQALEEKADLPARPPALPSWAADRAADVHESTAFGKKGEATRAAHGEAGDPGKAADEARAAVASRAAQGAAASAAGAAAADAHAAAGQARAAEAQKTHSKPPTPGPHGP